MSSLKINQSVLDDLCSRFLLNIPAHEKDDMVRLCFQIELAHWFYLDFYRPEDTSLPDCNMLEFTKLIFKEYPFLLKPSDANVMDIFDRWKSYKRNVPTYGAILLDRNLEYVLLVQGYWIKASWGFPKGKVNQSENAEICAAREVLEETGFDISGMIDKTQYAEHHMNEQLARLYFVRDVPMNVAFKPKTRGEIKKVQWFAVNDLPAHKKDPTPKQSLNIAANNFFMVLPFVKQLRRWIAVQRQTTPPDPIARLGLAPKPTNDDQSRVPAKQPNASSAVTVLSADKTDKTLRDHQVQLFGQGNSRELESIQASFSQSGHVEQSPRQQRRRGRGQPNNGQSPRAINHLLGGANKGRGRGLQVDFMPDAWKNFTFDKEELLKAIAGFSHNNGRR